LEKAKKKYHRDGEKRRREREHVEEWVNECVLLGADSPKCGQCFFVGVEGAVLLLRRAAMEHFESAKLPQPRLVLRVTRRQSCQRDCAVLSHFTFVLPGLCLFMHSDATMTTTKYFLSDALDQHSTRFSAATADLAAKLNRTLLNPLTNDIFVTDEVGACT
jgi:hypothetical protein